MDGREAYEKEGYLVVRRLFSPAEMAALEEGVDRVYGQWLAANADDVAAFGMVNMHSLTRSAYFQDAREERIRFFRAIANERLTSLMAAVFGDGIYFHNSQLFFNPEDPERPPYWHRDMQYNPVDEAIQKAELGSMLSLHIRVPLVAETGIELIPGSHRRWDSRLERSVRLELDGHANSEDLPGARLIPLQPGDVLVFSAQMIHRGNYALNRERKALDLCVGKAHPRTSGALDREVLPTEEEMVSIANDGWYRLAHAIVSAASARSNPDGAID